MKFNPITAAIILVVVVAWGIVVLQSNDRPDLLPRMAGCFEGPDSVSRGRIRISASGEFVTPVGGETTVSVYEDKLGLSLLPKETVVVQNGVVSLVSGHPFLLRIEPDQGSFLVPNEEGPDVRFQRASCA